MASRFITDIGRLLLSLFVLALVSCQGPQSAGGLETTNGLSAHVNGNTITGTTVRGGFLVLCDQHFSAGDTVSRYSDSTVADDVSGTYSFTALPNGTYNLFGWNRISDSSAFIPGIPVGTAQQSFSDSIGLAPNCMVNGMIFIDEITGRDSTSVYLAGSPFTTVSRMDGSFRIDDVPCGTYRIVADYTVLSRDESFTFTTLDTITVSFETENSDTLYLETKQ